MGLDLQFPAFVLGPPDWSDLLSIDDVDEASHRQSANAAYGSVSRECVGRGDLRLRISTVCLGRMPVRWSTTGVGQLIRVETTVPLVQIPLAGTFGYRVGRRHVEVWPGQVAVIRAGAKYVACYDAEVTMLSIVPSAGVRTAELGVAGERPWAAAGADPVRRLNGGKAMAQLGAILDALRTALPLAPVAPWRSRPRPA